MKRLKKAKKMIFEYNTVFQEEKEGGYSVWVPDLPGCASQGETSEEALKNIQAAIRLYLEETGRQETNNTFRKQFVMPVQVYA